MCVAPIYSQSRSLRTQVSSPKQQSSPPKQQSSPPKQQASPPKQHSSPPKQHSSPPKQHASPLPASTPPQLQQHQQQTPPIQHSPSSPSHYNFAKSFAVHQSSTSPPYTITLRPNETLSIVSVSGTGRLYMSCGDTKTRTVLVQKSLIHDSASYFHTKDGHAKYDNNPPYPGGFLYEFIVDGEKGGDLMIKLRQGFKFNAEDMVEEGEAGQQQIQQHVVHPQIQPQIPVSFPTIMHSGQHQQLVSHPIHVPQHYVYHSYEGMPPLHTVSQLQHGQHVQHPPNYEQEYRYQGGIEAQQVKYGQEPGMQQHGQHVQHYGQQNGQYQPPRAVMDQQNRSHTNSC